MWQSRSATSNQKHETQNHRLKGKMKATVTAACMLIISLSCFLVGCADPGAGYAELRRSFVATWGPEQNWTPQQKLYFIEAMNQYHAQQIAGIEQRNNSLRALRGYNAWNSEGSISQIAPNRNGDYSSYGGYTSQNISLPAPATAIRALGVNRYNPNSLANPYGAGSPYKADGLMNPYSQYGSPFSNKSWRNPYATDAPKLYDSTGNYRGRFSTNPYDADSTSNPYGRYGSKYSPDSINNPYGAGNPYSTQPIYVVPSQ
jgi:hypothetical protein